MHKVRVGLGILLLSGFMLPGVWAAEYNVLNTSSDAAVPGSLPWCVNAANLVTPNQPDVITFVTSNSITVHTVLTIIDRVEIRGNSNSVGCHDGSGASPQNCLAFATDSHGSTLNGLAIVDSTTGIALLSNHNRVTNCRVGVDWAGTLRGNVWGVYDQGQYNQIGGGPGQGNLISNNSAAGITLVNSLGSRVQGNTLGVDLSGTLAWGTQQVGIYLDGARQALIGGDRGLGLGNLVSGHTAYGLLLENETTFGNTLCGNVVGLNAAQTAAIPNQADGIRVQQASGNTIGLPVAGHENVVAGNAQSNINLYQGSVTPQRVRQTTVRNNFLGVNSSSVSGFISNSYNLYLNGADMNIIGGDRDTLERNVVSGNTQGGYGIYVIGNSNSICGNYIGTNDLGTAARANSMGIVIVGSDNYVGGVNLPGSRRGNVVSGNTSLGIYVQSGSRNAFYGNYVGLTGDGTAALGNGNRGFYLGGSSTRSLVGDLTPERRNVTAANTNGGMVILTSSLNRVQGNYLGMSADGTASLPDTGYGLEISASRQNWIEGNSFARYVTLNGLNTFGNTLVANRIGILPNGGLTGATYGVTLSNSAVGNFIGLPGGGQGNLITGLSQSGIALGNGTVFNNGLFGNTITAFTVKGISLLSGANNGHAAPAIGLAVAGTQISGTAGAGDRVEVFVAEGAAGNGGSVRYVGTATADGSGNWTLNPGGAVAAGEYVCATATDPVNNTSEFSTNVLVLPPPTPASTATFTVTPTPTIPPTPTPSPTVTATSALSGADLGGKTVLAFPNPAREQMRFVFHLDAAAQVKFEIYNLSGERIATLSDDHPAGRGQSLTWDLKNVAPGIYIARMNVDGTEKAKIKVAVVK